jgi:hypothetical protein
MSWSGCQGYLGLTSRKRLAPLQAPVNPPLRIGIYTGTPEPDG